MAATEPEAGRPERRRAYAFGLDLDLSFPAPGLPEASGATGGRPARADLVEPGAIDRDWPAGEAEEVLAERFDDGAVARTIHAHPEAGYRLYARHFGLARLSPDGARIACSPPDVEPWSWQRFLVGRILPWAAVLRGLEAFHASAVETGGRAVAFVGATGAGKTSLAIQLVGRGASFLTDDVLALERRGGVLWAHPGAGIASVRPAERETISGPIWERLGSVLGESGKTYLEVPRRDGPVPLAAVYYLRPGGDAAIEPFERPDPRLLLASTFVLGVRTPERLANQLDVCSALARTVPVFWLRVDAGEGSARLAAAVDDHVRALEPVA
ncbi:MAG TPA: hypothetical protein VF712_04820 [Thermoleophilaceae bacterium]|jgi:hypothetical protein